MKTRVIALDVARALALFGMVLVNFKLTMDANVGSEILLNLTEVLEGRASALFVVLAGIGISLATQASYVAGDRQSLLQSRVVLIKRAFLLMLAGLGFLFIWPADILHFYGVYFLFAAFLFSVSNRRLLLAVVGFMDRCGGGFLIARRHA